MDNLRLKAALESAAETERAIRFALDTEENPLELARGWSAYRYAVGLRKALSTWNEQRAAMAAEQHVGS